MSLDNFLKQHNYISNIEGNSGNIIQQTNRLKELVSDVRINSILEIGFNAGHSSDTFLSSSLANVTSFDLGAREYVLQSKYYIDKKYPTRHTLVIGDSKHTIPAYTNQHPEKKFDVIFIDGDHTHEGSMYDILHCRTLSHKDTLVIMDDIVVEEANSEEWTTGPTLTWSEAVSTGIIEHHGGDFYGKGRGMCWGRYLLS